MALSNQERARQLDVQAFGENMRESGGQACTAPKLSSSHAIIHLVRFPLSAALALARAER
jgi:hypothetical protein